jgi:hypothetical protein
MNMNRSLEKWSQDTGIPLPALLSGRGTVVAQQQLEAYAGNAGAMASAPPGSFPDAGASLVNQVNALRSFLGWKPVSSDVVFNGTGSFAYDAPQATSGATVLSSSGLSSPLLLLSAILAAGLGALALAKRRRA